MFGLLAPGPVSIQQCQAHQQLCSFHCSALFQKRSVQTAAGVKPLARDARPVPIKIISISKGNSSGCNSMADEWLEKLRRYTTVTELQLKPNPKNTKEPKLQMEHEGEKVLKAVQAGDLVVVLDERGQDLRSEDVAQLLGAAGDEGTPIVFCIGGPFGHSPQVRSRANKVVRLSNLVLNHQVAYVVLIEQLYRGWTILSGSPYHH